VTRKDIVNFFKGKITLCRGLSRASCARERRTWGAAGEIQVPFWTFVFEKEHRHV
jgi:hypothetical protein